MAERKRRAPFVLAEEERPVQPRKVRKVRKARTLTPLQRFRRQTIQKRKELKATRRSCDVQLRQIERDLGVLKRK